MMKDTDENFETTFHQFYSGLIVLLLILITLPIHLAILFYKVSKYFISNLKSPQKY